MDDEDFFGYSGQLLCSDVPCAPQLSLRALASVKPALALGLCLAVGLVSICCCFMRRRLGVTRSSLASLPPP